MNNHKNKKISLKRKLSEEAIELHSMLKLDKEKDDFGLPQDGKLYAKRSCNNCWGKGMYTKLGEKPSLVMCGCAYTRYMRVLAKVVTRLTVETAKIEGFDKLTPEEQKAKREELLPAIRAEFGF